MFNIYPLHYVIILLELIELLFVVPLTRFATVSRKIPLSVNYYLTRVYNYSYGIQLLDQSSIIRKAVFNFLIEFCFHTAKTSHVKSLSNAKKGMALLKASGMKKINFAGGEPFINAEFLGQLVKYCKETLKVESVSVVTNDSKVTRKWLAKYDNYLDIMAVSCDSFDNTTNIKIGRGTGNHVRIFMNLCEMCKEYNVMFKVNTVVNRYNVQEDINATIDKIKPFRWKCF